MSVLAKEQDKIAMQRAMAEQAYMNEDIGYGLSRANIMAMGLGDGSDLSDRDLQGLAAGSQSNVSNMIRANRDYNQGLAVLAGQQQGDINNANQTVSNYQQGVDQGLASQWRKFSK